MNQVFGVQYLRALAALAVVVFHASVETKGAFQVGAAGVDVFFVISGFIMWLTTARETAPGLFLKLRAIRIIPLYWGVTLFVAAMAVMGLAPSFDPDPVRIVKSLLFIPHLNPHGELFPFITPGWTLNYEVFFYLVFAGALFLPRRLQLWAITGVFVLLVTLGLIWPYKIPAWITYSHPLLLEFVAGAWLGWAWCEKRLPSAATGLIAVAVGLAAFAAQFLAHQGFPPNPLRLALWGGPAFLLVAGALSLEAAGKMPKWGWLKTLGDGSYSIYLGHTVLISMLAKVAGGLPASVFIVMVVACSAAAGVLGYRLVEAPVTRRLRRLLVRPSRRPAVAT